MALSITACKEEDELYEFDQQSVLGDIVQGQILPSMLHFQIQTQSLKTEVNAFSQNANTVQLASTKAQWITTNLRWKQCELFDFGKISDRYAHNGIGKWPTDINIIESKIGSGQLMDEAFFESLGASSSGLPAIEYLLFDKSESEILASFTTDTLAAERLAYLQGIADILHQKAQKLLNIWSASGENYASEFTHSSAQGLSNPMSLLVNGMISLIEEDAKTKVGKPFGKFDFGILSPELVESHRANISLELLRANVVALQTCFLGSGGNGISNALDDLHAEYEDAPLSGIVADQFDLSIAAIDDLTIPLQDAMISEANKVEALYQALKQLTVLFKADICSAMSITVTVSDNDGD